MIRAILLTAAWLAASMAQAQEADPTPPTPPVASFPAFTKWRIEPLPPAQTDKVIPEEETPVPANQIRSVTLRSDGRLQLVEATLGDGSKFTVYNGEGNAAYFDRGDGRPVIVGNRTGKTSLDLLFVPGFPLVGWVTPDDFDGIESVDGVPCFRYVRKGLNPEQASEDTDEFQLLDLTAWIRVENAYPFRVSARGQTFQFSGPEPAPGTIQIPEGILSAVQQYDKEKASLRRGGRRSPTN